MGRKEFDRFIQRKQEERSSMPSLDEKKELSEWLDNLENLYDLVSEYIKSYIKDGTMRIEFKNIEINEDFSGTYEAQSMRLYIGTSEIVFEPIGTMLIGSKGRVDIHGPRGTARLSLVNKKVEHARQMIRVRVSIVGQPATPPEPSSEPEEIEWVWKIMTPAPDMRFITLTEDTFFDTLLGVADA